MKVNLSNSRLRKVRRYLARALQDARLDDEEQLFLAVGALICNDTGSFSEADLLAAFQDPSIVQVARVQLERAGGVTRP